jgi:hypothetical protein
MSDNIEVTWKVTAMDCYPTFSGQKDYVFNVHWDCLSYYSGISGGPFYGRSNSVTMLGENTGEFTPYTGLKESMVLSWVWDILGTGKNEYEEKSSSQIYNVLVPSVITLPLPWASGVSPM